MRSNRSKKKHGIIPLQVIARSFEEGRESRRHTPHELIRSQRVVDALHSADYLSSLMGSNYPVCNGEP
jgi:hypothetical protein